MDLQSSTQPKVTNLTNDGLEELFERNRIRIQRLLAEAAALRTEQARIRAEIKHRNREGIWL
jgi:hypothetical protein